MVGWADGGRSVLYSAKGGDGNALPDVRMFRLRLSWDGGDGSDGGGTDGVSGTEEKKGEDPIDEEESGSDFNIDGARSYVDEATSTAEAPDSTADHDGDDKSDRGRSDRQRRHLAGLRRERARARRSTAGSAVNAIVEPVPLAQALEGAYHARPPPSDSPSNSTPACLYFTRFGQPSSTKRYVGGTAPSIWVHCGDDPTAYPLTHDYNGTSRFPTVVGDALLFLSDRGDRSNGDGWTPGGTDLWGVPLGGARPGGIIDPIRLTRVSCWRGGLDLMEYAADPATGDVVLRVGADLHLVPGAGIRARLEKGDGVGLPEVRPLGVAVHSDFGYMHERLVPLSVGKHLTGVDAYETAYGSASALVTARGQSFVAPVVKEARPKGRRYGGGGSNMPGELSLFRLVETDPHFMGGVPT